MIRLRFLLHLSPWLLLAVGWWSAEVAGSTRARRAGEVVAMLPGALPEWNALAPRSAVEQELVGLLYEPLLQAGPPGGPSVLPVLASHWDWNQELTCWFASPDWAARAADHLRQLDADRWIQLGLDQIWQEGDELRLSFSQPQGTGPDEALRELAPFEPLPVDFVQLRLPGQARSYLNHFLQSAVEKRQVRRTWFEDSDQLAELVISGSPGSAVEELRRHFEALPELQAQVTPMDRVTALREPVLEFRLQPGRVWPDGTPVTARDVIATVRHVIDHRIPVPERENLLAIQNLAMPGPDRLRVTYRRYRGAALASWMRLPILQAQWLEHQAAGPSSASPGHASASHQVPLPPGTGPFRPTWQRDGTLTLVAAPHASARIHRLRLLHGAPEIPTQAAFATGSIDLYWPANERLPRLRREPGVLLHPSSPRSRLVVLWNTRQPPLDELRIRQALALATDRSALREELVQGAGSEHAGLFQPDVWFSPPHTPQRPDLSQASALLDEAGWFKNVTTGLRTKPGATLSIELLTTAGNAQREQLATRLARQWRRLGLEVSIRALPWEELVGERLQQRDFQALILGLDFETSWDQLPLWHSSQATPGGLNFSGLTDPETDLLLQSLALEFDPNAVPERVRRLEARIASLHPFLPLFTDQGFVAIRKAALPAELKTAPTLANWLLHPPLQTPPSPAIPMRVPEEAPTLSPPRPPPAPLPPPPVSPGS